MMKVKMYRKSFLGLIMTLFLVGCHKEVSWQDYFDLGQQYLTEEEYEEAIVAFTKAIEMDPNQTAAYLGRGEAYIKSEETEENLALAQADYEKALSLDSGLTEGYLGLADVHVKQDDLERAVKLLEEGYRKTGNEELNQKLSEYLQRLSKNLADEDGEENEPEDNPQANENTEDELTDRMKLLESVSANEDGLQIEGYYPDKETYLICLETWAGKGADVPYEIVDHDGNVILSGYQSGIWRTEDGYARVAYFKKGTLDEASEDLLYEYDFFYNPGQGPIDVYAELYDWSGNFVERQKLERDPDNEWLNNGWSEYPYPSAEGSYWSQWEEQAENFRNEDYSASEDVLDIEQTDDGFIVRDKFGKELGYIKNINADELQPIVMENVLGLWEKYGYGCARYYWVDLGE